MLKASGWVVALWVCGCSSDPVAGEHADSEVGEVLDLIDVIDVTQDTFADVSELVVADTADSADTPDVPAPSASMRLHFLDVGQGDAMIVELPCGAMLVDTGGELSDAYDGVATFEAQVREFFAGRPDLHATFDLVVLSHPHIDHTRGVPMLLDMVAAGELVIRNVVTNGAEGDGSGVLQQRMLHDHADANVDIGRWYVLQRTAESTGIGDEVIDPFGPCMGVDPRVTALWGRVDGDSPLASEWDRDTLSNDNNHSVVLRIDFGAASALLTGDLEEAAIASLIAQYEGTGLLDVDAYKVGHHGSYNGTTAALVNVMSPSLAVISSGPATRTGQWTAWDFGHPRLQAVSDLVGDIDSVGVSLARTTPLDALVAVDYAGGHGVFEPRHITDAVYCTGWEGAVVVELYADGAIDLPP